METFLSGVALAAIMGLSYLAYRHPAAYAKMYWPLISSLFLAMILISIWNIGINHFYTKIPPDMFSDNWKKADEIYNDSQVPWWWFVSLIILNIYFGFLGALPFLLHGNEPPKPKDDEKDD